MKKFCTFLLTTALLCIGLSAQPSRSPQGGNLSIAASGGEKFVVYIDGEPHSSKAVSSLVVKGLAPGSHDVIVVLHKPEERAAHALVNVKPGPLQLTVAYSRRSKALRIEGAESELPTPQFPQRPTPPGDDDRRHDARNNPAQPPQRTTPPTNDDRRHDARHQPAQPEPVADREVSEMTNRLRTEAFSHNRLELAKNYAATRPMTASQIAQLAATIDLDNDRLNFLKYAYDYCLDPTHYDRTLDVLTFSSNRQNLLKHIEQKRKK